MQFKLGYKQYRFYKVYIFFLRALFCFTYLLKKFLILYIVEFLEIYIVFESH